MRRRAGHALEYLAFAIGAAIVFYIAFVALGGTVT